jgi:hypothetical protein
MPRTTTQPKDTPDNVAPLFDMTPLGDPTTPSADTLTTIADLFSFEDGTGRYRGNLTAGPIMEAAEAIRATGLEAIRRQESLAGLYRQLAAWKWTWLKDIVHVNDAGEAGPDYQSLSDLAKKTTAYLLYNPLRELGATNPQILTLSNGISQYMGRDVRDPGIRSDLTAKLAESKENLDPEGRVKEEILEAAVDAAYARQGKLSPRAKRAKATADRNNPDSPSMGSGESGGGEADRKDPSPVEDLARAVAKAASFEGEYSQAGLHALLQSAALLQARYAASAVANRSKVRVTAAKAVLQTMDENNRALFSWLQDGKAGAERVLTTLPNGK